MANEPPVNQARFVIRLLGPPRIEGPEGVLDGPPAQRHRLALLALLATSPHATMSRSTLMGLLWPETSAESARVLLNSAVHAIRQAIGKDVLVTRGDSLILTSSEVSVDVLEFQEAVRLEDIPRALEWHSGPLLDGLSLPDAVEFEHWQDRERARLEDLYHVALERHAESVTRVRGPREAVPIWRNRLACTPTDSRTAIRLMQALAAAGDRAGAIHVAEVHARLLREEFDAEPNRDVERLAEDIRRSQATAPINDSVIAGHEGSRDPADSPPAAGRVAARRLDGTAERDGPENDPPPDPPHPPLVGVDHGHLTERPPSAERRPRRRTITRKVVVVPLSVLVIAGAARAAWRKPSLPASCGPPGSIAVAWFTSPTADSALAGIGASAAGAITEQVSREVREPAVVPAGCVLELNRGKLAHSPSRDSDLAQVTSAALLVTGTVTQLSDSLEYRAELIVPRTGEPLFAARPARGRLDGLDYERPAEDLGEQITVAVLVYTEARRTGGVGLPDQSLPRTVAVYRELERLYEANARSDFEAVLAHLSRIRRLEPGFAMAYFIAAKTAYNLGLRTSGNYDQRTRLFRDADSLLSIAESQRSLLTEDEIDQVAYLRAWFDGDKDAEYRVMKRSVARFPELRTYNAAVTSYRTGRYEEALHHIGEGPPGEWWDRDLVHQWALHQLGRFEEELAAANDNIARRGTDPLTAAGAVRALAALGRRAEVDALLQTFANMPPVDSQRLRSTGGGEIRRPGDVLVEAAWEFLAHEHLTEAQAAFQRYLQTGARTRTAEDADSGRALAQSLMLTGRSSDARRVFEALARTEPRDPALLGQLGIAAILDGDTAAASAIANRLTGFDVPFLRGEHTVWRSRMAASAGACDAAELLLRMAFSQGANHDLSHHLWFSVGDARSCTNLEPIFDPRD